MTNQTQAETLRRAAASTTRLNADVALLCEHAQSAADRLEVLEREHAKFYDLWHMELRRRTRLGLLLREIKARLNEESLAMEIALTVSPWAGEQDESSHE